VSERSGVFLDLGSAGRWSIAGADPRARGVVDRLARLARLGSRPDSGSRRLIVSGGCEDAPQGNPFPVSSLTLRIEPGSGEVRCVLPEPGMLDERSILPLHLLNVPAFFAVGSGAVLLHASLVAREGRGFALAGRSGAGKSTAAARVPPPWEALCDDVVLAVPGGDGGWRAHPFPTWGRVIVEERGSWEVERSVPLAGIFFLEQAPEDGAVPLGAGEALCLLNEVAGQASCLLAEGMGAPEARAMRLTQFENLARLAAEVPCARLRATLDGAFWKHLGGGRRMGGRIACASAP